MTASRRAWALALAAHRLGSDAALARLRGPGAGEAMALLHRLRTASGAVTTAVTELRQTRPRGWHRVHPSWIDAALGKESGAVRHAVVAGGERPHERTLARWFLGGLVSMRESNGTALERLLGLEASVLTQVLATLGRRQLAHAVLGASPPEVAIMAARMPQGRELIVEVGAVARLGERADARLGRRRSAVARTAGVAWTEPLALVRVGMRGLAPRCVDHGDLALEIAQRLPRPIGQVAALELRGPFAIEPDDGVSEVEIAAAIARGTVGS